MELIAGGTMMALLRVSKRRQSAKTWQHEQSNQDGRVDSALFPIALMAIPVDYR